MNDVFMMTNSDVRKRSTLSFAMLLWVLALLGYVLVEPALSQGAITDAKQFLISQVVGTELSFMLPPTTITMSPSIGGLTGGTANGLTQVIIRTSDSAGFTMTLQASSSVGMLGNASSSNSIPALQPASVYTPDFSFDSGSLAAHKAAFGYSVEASATNDLATAWKDNGSVCGGAGVSDTPDKCWLNASTTAVNILYTTGPTLSSGSTSTLKFRVVVQPLPTPMLPSDIYVATSTITITGN